MKATAPFAMAAGLVLSIAACSQFPENSYSGTGDGPGMMDGYYGGGPRMMRGYDPGDDSEDEYGPGMMGRYYGAGMMGGGYGPGMMNGYGYGPGMMGGWHRGWGMSIPDLSDDQRKKIEDIQKDYRQRQWALMQSMHELQFQQGGITRDGKFDEQAARKAFDARESLRKQMFENRIQMQKRVEEVLTPKQREQMQRNWGR